MKEEKKMKKSVIVFSIIFFICTGVVKGEQKKSLPWEELLDVKITEQTETSANVVIETTGEVRFHIFKLSNPSRLVVEIVDVVHNWRKKELDVGGNLITRIRSGQYKNDPVKIVRVVLDMSVKDYFYDKLSEQNQIKVSLRRN
jgi:hypothetical protein